MTDLNTEGKLSGQLDLFSELEKAARKYGADPHAITRNKKGEFCISGISISEAYKLYQTKDNPWKKH